MDLHRVSAGLRRDGAGGVAGRTGLGRAAPIGEGQRCDVRMSDDSAAPR